MLERFSQLFVGGTHAHGVWQPESGDCQTVKVAATPQDYADHLAGKLGLGLVPVDLRGECRFAAIDVDVDTINHVELHATVARHQMPLHVCRSKSGGAHLYLFAREPVKASLVIPTLKRWAGLLGFPRAEVFPKQTKVSTRNLGSWINLPYFSADHTLRYAVGPAGALSLEQFLDSVTYWDGEDRVAAAPASTDLVQLQEMPPCLATLTTTGLPEGERNSGLFNVAVFYRKSRPDQWEDLTLKYNQAHVQPPLPFREVQAVLKSVGQRRYQYTCDQEPICSRCDRKTCLTLRFGVGNQPWKDAESFDEVQYSHLRKILTDPPQYLLEVNGHDLVLTTDQLRDHRLFAKRAFEVLDVVVVPLKSGPWLQVVKDLLLRKQDVEAPVDASAEGALVDKVFEFLALHERARSREDLLRHVPVLDGDDVAFRVADLQKYLHSQRVDKVENREVYRLLHSFGCTYGSLRLKGKVVTAWRVPRSKLNEQTEPFTPPVPEPEPEL